MPLENYLDELQVRETVESLQYISNLCEGIAKTECPWRELAQTFLSIYYDARDMQKATPEFRKWFASASAQLLYCGCQKDKKEMRTTIRRVNKYDDTIWDAALSQINVKTTR